MGGEEDPRRLLLGFPYGFEKFRLFFHGNREGYDWDCILPSQVEDIIINGGEYKEHKHTKAARMGLQDPQGGICLLITVVEVAY